MGIAAPNIDGERQEDQEIGRWVRNQGERAVAPKTPQRRAIA
ncbi:hypothetical protein ELI_03010 [Erythrobacter litoralis HTCC2594]|uniref:Uncharacterized protein n=1 Tax=Erythrobacter litoralis (strain HTCC2594) TaxID=314225 RepID=Q2NC97_ERYLH|nr:hypothetical protein ELI_03010 [Erythrobacter litoralis HTCC2594]